MLRSRLLAAVATLAVGLLVGCSREVTGTGSPPPRAADLISRTVAAMKAMPGFAVTSTVTINGRTASTAYRIQGDDGTGTLTLDGSTVEVLRVDGQAYARGPATFWRALSVSATAAATIDGRWTEVSANSVPAVGFDAPAYYKALTDNADLASRPVRAGNVDGVRVWILDAGSPSAAIAADGPPRLVQLRYGDTGSVYLTYPTDQLQVGKPDGVVPFPR